MRPDIATLLTAVLLFLAVVLLARADSPAHAAKIDTSPVSPVLTRLDVPILVINLEANTERLRQFASYFADSDFKNQQFTRLPAVDGKTVDLTSVVAADVMPQLTRTITTETRTSHEQLTVGAVGCYLSHLKAWRTILDSGKAWGLVFEDDAEISRHALKNTLASMESLPADWDILLLGTACISKCPLIKNTALKTVTHFVRFHGYAISAKACAYLLSADAEMLRMRMQVDWKLSQLAAQKKLKIFATKKFLVDSGYAGTTIQVRVIE